MTAKQIESAIKTASKCIEKDAQLEKKLGIAEWDGKPTSRIQSSIDTNKAKTAALLDELAREEMSGTSIDFASVEGVAGCVACCVSQRPKGSAWIDARHRPAPLHRCTGK
jgi:hypothetical protein